MNFKLLILFVFALSMSTLPCMNKYDRCFLDCLNTTKHHFTNLPQLQVTGIKLFYVVIETTIHRVLLGYLLTVWTCPFSSIYIRSFYRFIFTNLNSQVVENAIEIAVSLFSNINPGTDYSVFIIDEGDYCLGEKVTSYNVIDPYCLCLEIYGLT